MSSVDELVAPGDVLDFVDMDGRRTRYLVTATTPRLDGMAEYQLLSDPDNDEGPAAPTVR